MTRALDSLVLMTEKGRESPFLVGIEQDRKLTPVVWKDLAPVRGPGDRFVEVRVPGRYAYAVKEQLKRDGYRWNAVGKYWYRSATGVGFSLDKFRKQAWAQPGVRIEAYDGGGKLIERIRC